MKCLRARLVRLFIFFCLVTTNEGCGTGGGGGENDQIQGSSCEAIGVKIANGEQCSGSHNRSSLIRLNFVGLSDIGLCSGTAITQHVVVTAAHCFASDFYKIVVETNSASFEASDFLIHPLVNIAGGLNGQVLYNDLALVYVEMPLGVNVSPILGSREPQINETGQIAGFGETSFGGELGQLFAGVVSVEDRTINHIFVKYQDNESHPCRGDSGGPLFLEVDGVLTLAGVVSQSDPSVDADSICEKGDVTLFTNIANPVVLDFIKGNAVGVRIR